MRASTMRRVYEEEVETPERTYRLKMLGTKIILQWHLTKLSVVVHCVFLRGLSFSQRRCYLGLLRMLCRV